MMGNEYYNYPINRIIVATSGSAFNHILKYPGLYDTIILDEIHELNEQTQQVLSLIMILQPIYHFKIILMSATADIDLINNTFQDIAHFELEGIKQQQQYIVQVEQAKNEFTYNKRTIKVDIPTDLNIQGLIDVGVLQAIRIMTTMDNIKGDVLVFLPGIREMETFKFQFEKQARKFKISKDSFQLMYFHSMFSQTYKKQFNNMTMVDENEEQDEQESSTVQVEGTPTSKYKQHTFRRIILCTTICETSLTIPSLYFVIDTCMNKCKIQNRLQICLASKNNMLQRKGRVGRCNNGMYIYCLDTNAVENLEQQRQDEAYQDMIAPLIFNDALYNLNLLQSAMQLNNNIQDDEIQRTKQYLLETNCLGYDTEDNIRCTYKGYKTVHQITTIQFQQYQYVQQFINSKFGVLISNINTQSNRKLFLEQIELGKTKHIEQKIVLIAAQLGYRKFNEVIQYVSQQNQKIKVENLLAYIFQKYGSQTLLTSYDSQVLLGMIVLYWRRRFPLPTHDPTEEEQQWCNLLGLNPSGLRQIELSYIQFYQICLDKELSIVDNMIGKQYYILTAEQLDCQINYLKTQQQNSDSFKNGKLYRAKSPEQLHEEIWKDLLKKYLDNQTSSLYNLCEEIKDTYKISQYCQGSALVNSLINNNYRIKCNIKSNKAQQSIKVEQKRQLLNCSTLFFRGNKQQLSNQYKQQLQNDIYKDSHVQLIKDGLILTGDDEQEQFIISLILGTKKSNNNSYISIQNHKYELSKNIFFMLQNNNKIYFTQKSQIYVGIIFESYTIVDKQNITSLSSNGIGLFMLYLILNQQYIVIQFKYEDDIEDIRNLQSFSIQIEGETQFTYNFECFRNHTVLDKAMMEFLEVTLLMNYYQYQTIKQDLINNQLLIVEGQDDTFLQQLCQNQALINYSRNSPTCKSYMSQLSKCNQDQMIHSIVQIILQIFQRIDFSYKQLQYFTKNNYESLYTNYEYQLTYNPMVYKEFQVK